MTTEDRKPLVLQSRRHLLFDGWGYLAAAVVCFAMSAWNLLEVTVFDHRTMATTGTIRDVWTGTGIGLGRRYARHKPTTHVKIAFCDSANRSFEREAPEIRWKNPPQVGGRVGVLYDPDKPQNFRIDTGPLSSSAPYWAGLGMVLVGVGLYRMFRRPSLAEF